MMDYRPAGRQVERSPGCPRGLPRPPRGGKCVQPGGAGAKMRVRMIIAAIDKTLDAYLGELEDRPGFWRGSGTPS